MPTEEFERSLQHAAAQLLVAAERDAEELSEAMKTLAAQLQIMSVAASRRP